MDKIIESPKGWKRFLRKKYIPYIIGLLVLSLLGYLILSGNSNTFKTDKDTLTIRQVTSGKFNDYIRITGQVQPMTTIQLTPLENGVVQEIFIEEGMQVKEGTPILRLSNDNLDMQILNSEADLAEKENILRNTMISMEQQRLSVRQECLQLATEVKRMQRKYRSQHALYQDRLISQEDYLQAKEDFELAQDKLRLVRERAVQDSLYRNVEIRQMRESLDNMRINMQMIRKRKESLIIKAPASGELGLLEAVLGQSLQPGEKIGQISQTGDFKIEAQVDEHYIDRISLGLTAVFKRQDTVFSAIVRKIYPEVRNGKFRADFKFTGKLPAHIRTGQTYYLDLQLRQPEQALLIPRGAFYQKTGGKWIYVVNTDGTEAHKREIRIGRQNPQFYEVLEGLDPGEKVITSSYDNFGDNEHLILKQ